MPRLTTFPIQDQELWLAYKRQQACFWTIEEVDLSKDRNDWEKLNDNERYFIKHILAFFAASDSLVNENLLERFTREVEELEAMYFYIFQAMMECVHSELYSALIDTYITDSVEKQTTFDAVENFEAIKKKAEWTRKWTQSDNPFVERLVAFAIVEGVFFSGAFCSIFWLKERGLMSGLTISNEFISRDEGMHTEFACLMYKKQDEKMSKERIYEIMKEAIEIEHNFITEALPCNLIGMNCELMKQYICFVADYLLVQLGVPKLYNVTNPFSFMNQISLEGKTNFFEERTTQYQKAGVMGTLEDRQFSLDEEF